MGRKIIGKARKKDDKYYFLQVPLNRSKDGELIDAIQKLPVGRRTSLIRSILYVSLVAGAKVSYDEEAEIQKKNAEGKTPKDVKSEIKSFLKFAKGNRNEK